MRGEHRVQLRALPAGGETLKILAICGEAGGLGGRGKQPPQLARARFQPVTLQLGDQRGQIVERNLAPLQRARQIERQLKHRVEQRRFARALVQLAQPGFEGGDGFHECSEAKAAAAPNRPGCGWTMSLTGMPAIRLSKRPLALNREPKPEASSVSRMR